MNLDQLVTQENADTGVWFPVELYGKPADFDLLILGDDSDTIQRYGRAKMKKLKNLAAKEKKNGDDGFSDEIIDEMLESGDEDVIVKIAGIRGWKTERKGSNVIGREPEPVTLNGKELGNDKESYRLLVSKIPAIKEFVLKKAGERANFLSGRSGNWSGR